MINGSNKEILTVDESILAYETTSSDSISDASHLYNLPCIDDTNGRKAVDIKTELFKSVICQLEEKVETLKEDVKFLKDEISHKNALITFFTSQHVSNTPERHNEILNDSSILLHNILGGKSESPGNLNVTTRPKRNPADMNMWSSYEDEEVNFIDSEVNDASSVVSEETSRRNIIKQLEEVRNLKHCEYVNKKEKEKIVMLSTSKDERKHDSYQLAPWEKHSTGFATRTMKKMGYNGKGLGKFETGIVEPITMQNVRNTTMEQKHDNGSVDTPQEPNDVIPWPKNTVLITGSSMIQGVDENRMSRKLNVKVRPNRGATTRDMYDHLNALLRKKPKYLILHVGSNDASNDKITSDDLYDRLIRLKSYAEKKVPGMQITLSCPTIRTDNRLANIKIIHLRNRLKREGINILSNENITEVHLGKKGLHLTNRGTSRLAMNMIAFIQGL